MKAEFLITNALLVTMDDERRIIEDGAVAVAGDRIVAVGARPEVEGAVEAARVLDAGGNIVVPGFVDALGHAGQTLARPASADRPVESADALAAFLRGADADFWRAEGQLNAAQSLNLGITTVQRLMPPVDTDLDKKAPAYLAALDDTGLTARVVLSAAGQAEGLADCAGLLEEDSRYGLCLRGQAADALCRQATPEQAPPELARDAAAIKAALALPAAKGRALLCYAGGGELRWLLREVPGLLANAPMLFGLHGAGFDELARVRDAGASYLYSPETFLPNAHLLHQLFEGIACAVTPASLSGRYPADLLLTARRAVLYDVTAENDYHYLPAGKMLELITCEAAKAIGMADEVGALAVGKRADINIFKWKKPALTPNFMPVQMLIFRGYGQDIETVMAGGRLVKQNGRLVNSPDLARTLPHAPQGAGREGA